MPAVTAMLLSSWTTLLLFWIHHAVAIPEESSLNSALERRADTPRFQWIGCTPEQETSLNIAAPVIAGFAVAGYRAAQCDPMQRRYDTFRYFFNRDRDKDVASAVFSAIAGHTLPASQGGRPGVQAVRCARPTDEKCATPGSRTRGSRLSYIFRYNMNNTNRRSYPQLRSMLDERGYLSMITLCPAVWTETSPLPVGCPRSVKEETLTDTIVSVLFEALIHVASGLALHDLGPGLFTSNSVGASLALNAPSNTDVATLPVWNAKSYVYSSFLAWMAGWAANPADPRWNQNLRDCLIQMFSGQSLIQPGLEGTSQAGLGNTITVNRKMRRG